MNMRLGLAFVAAVVGVATQFPILIILGLLGVAHSWFTIGRRYLIYQNALVIMYGRPRVKAIPFSDISSMEKVALPGGEMLRVRLTNGKPVTVSVSNVPEFQARLEEALERFNNNYVQPRIVEPKADPGPDFQGPDISQDTEGTSPY